MEIDEYLRDVKARLYPWMDDGQFECLRLACDVFCGYTELRKNAQILQHRRAVEVVIHDQWLSTWSNNFLTMLVVFAHDRCIRVTIRPCYTDRLSIFLERKSRDESGHEYHPEIEKQIATIRGYWNGKQ